MADAQDKRLGFEAEPERLVDSADLKPGAGPGDSQGLARVSRDPDEETRGDVPSRLGADWPFV